MKKYPILMDPKTKAQDLKKVEVPTQTKEKTLTMPQTTQAKERAMKTQNPETGTSTV